MAALGFSSLTSLNSIPAIGAPSVLSRDRSSSMSVLRVSKKKPAASTRGKDKRGGNVFVVWGSSQVGGSENRQHRGYGGESVGTRGWLRFGVLQFILIGVITLIFLSKRGSIHPHRYLLTMETLYTEAYHKRIKDEENVKSEAQTNGKMH